MSSQVIADALLAYDKGQRIINHLRNTAYIVSVPSDSDLKRGKMIFKDKKTDEIIFESEIEMMGAYYDGYKIFIWSWAQAQLRRPYIYLTKKALQYALDLEPNKVYLRSILSLSRGTVTHPIQVDINVATCAYLIKQPYIMPLISSVGNGTLVRYVILLNKQGLRNLESKIYG